MFAFVARTATFALALLATRGCIGPDGQQLLTEDGSDASPWTECMDGVTAEGRNGDYCTFEEGSGCAQQDWEAEGQPWTSNTCVGGRLIRSRNTRLAETYPEGRCEAPNVTDWYRLSYDVRRGTDGCLEVSHCDETGPGSHQVICQDPGADGLRPGAEDVAPWVDCEEAIQGATDRDPCVGDFICGGERELAPGRGTGTLGAFCDQGVLRLYTFEMLRAYY